MAEESGEDFAERIKKLLAQSEAQLSAIQEEFAERIEQHWKAQQQAVADLIEQQRQRGAKFADELDARRQQITDQIEEQWAARRAWATDLIDRQSSAAKDAYSRLMERFKSKPE
jgi:hypothetical protein